MAKNVILGIDLGTTYSAVAYVDENGEAKIIPNDKTERITPSVVFFENESNIVVGQNAKDESELSPEKVVSFVKRNMGNKKETSNEDGMPYKMFGRIYSPEEISAQILLKLKQDAERAFGGIEIRDVVITVPAYFNDSQKTATKDAGQLAGLNVLQLINEPTAAAISYAVKSNEFGKKLFVFDLGGGTFDITILDYKMDSAEKVIDVIDSDGDSRLGGKDWDDVIIEYVKNQIVQEHGERIDTDPVGYADLRLKVEKAKKALSERDSAKIFGSANGKRFSIELTREKFEELSAKLLIQTETLCQILINRNSLTWNDIDALLLVGGSTRMPMVKRMLKNISGKEIRDDLVQPDECVALGAALKGAMIGIEQNNTHLSSAAARELGSVVTNDILSKSIGIVSLDTNTNEDVMSFILKRQEKIPTRSTMGFVTVAEGQSGMNIDVREGESDNPENCHKLGMQLLKFNRPLPKGAPVDVTFSMDTSGLLNIHAVDKTDNAEIKFKVERINNLTEAEMAAGIANMNKLTIKG
jgi:molecular chaperone DnaK